MMALRTKLRDVQPSSMGTPRIDNDITTCIGRTKLVRINNTEKEGRVGEVIAKLEYTNPCLSIKDRIAIQCWMMLKPKERSSQEKQRLLILLLETQELLGEWLLLFGVIKWFKSSQNRTRWNGVP
mmetsp:Transcript_17268/g.31273  ORF Transcript_17268/g.31273 Transcript_17268/m.31273 type:complete len:125 (+) Transcript_17268:2219-2593(+)